MTKLNLAVVGNSVAVLLVPPRTRRADGTYGEIVADRLAAEGHDVSLALEGRVFGFATQALRGVDDRLIRHAPDIVILQFGVNESQPWILPVWLLRHLMTTHRTTTNIGLRYRERVVAPVWKRVRGFRRRVAPHVHLRTWQLWPDRFASAMSELVMALDAALVLVMDITPPGDTLEHFLPGQRERHAVFQEVLARVVAEADDPDVRLVRASSVIDDLGMDVASVDGIHFTAAGHAAVADLVETEIRDWLAGR